MKNNLYKERVTDVTTWVDTPGRIGELLVTFDGKKIYNLWEDYPWSFTDEERRIFDKENPFWANFFRDRTE